jgi:uncharacterized protein (DUF2384 family)
MAATAPTLPRQIRAMFDDTGRVDARALAEALGENTATLARAFNLEPKTVQKNPFTEQIQSPGRRLASMLEELTHYFNNDWRATMIWMRKPHPQLDDLSPLDVIFKEKDLNTIAGMVRAIGTGEPG